MHGPSTGFELPDGSFKQPDAAWISNDRVTALKEAGEEAFVTIVPDFVAEIRSGSDPLRKLRQKKTGT